MGIRSQINGGGCIAPPTPIAAESQLLTQILNSIGGLGDPRIRGLSNFDRYSKELPPSLAFRCSTRKQMVEGVGGYVNPTKLTVPEDPSKMGMVMRHGRLVRLNRPRKEGGVEWKTSSERAYDYQRLPQVYTFY